METIITRKDVDVVIGPARPTVIIGERINPTGKEWLKDLLRQGDIGSLAEIARAQVEAGAQIIDVNVMVPGIDEAKLLPQAVEVIQKAVNAPLCLDSSNVAAIRQALSVCDGKAIVNSVNGDAEKLEAILPLVRQYRASVIGLLIDRKSGIPKTVEQRIEIAHRILEAVEREGIPGEDLIIDCLTLSVSIEQPMARVSLDTISYVSKEMKLNVNMGISNVSFGLPERPLFNSTFISMAAAAGMTCAIVNPHSKSVREALLAADVLLGRDKRAKTFLQYYRSQKKSIEDKASVNG